ncbi:MAG TPA: hypothetical protein VIQ02_15400, partial [Jiangellaceae bacterium]
DNVVDVVPSKRRPVIIVRIDDDNLIFNRFQIAGRQARLLIEFGVLTASTVKIGGVDEARVDWPRTDSALEAFLDLLEWQIWCAMRGHSFWAYTYQKRWKYGSFSAYQSVPRYSAPERGAVRLAVRTLSMLVNLPPECAPTPKKEYSEPYPDVLPDNWVRVVEDLLCSTSGAFLKSVQELAAVIEAHGRMPVPTAPAFKRVWSSVPNLEIEAMWPIQQDVAFSKDDAVVQPPEFGTPTVEVIPPP